MNEKELKVYDLLCNWKGLQVMNCFAGEKCDFSLSQRKKCQELLDGAAERLAAWISLLDDDERFVVKRHLVDGISWVRVVYEYNRLLKLPEQKSYSSLRRMQQQAITKIALDSNEQKHTQAQVALIALTQEHRLTLKSDVNPTCAHLAV